MSWNSTRTFIARLMPAFARAAQHSVSFSKMADWSQPPQLVKLAAFYEQARLRPEEISDADFVANIEAAFWPTNCWSYVEASFAIIAPGCSLRPHLTRQLIAHPIEAMIAGGLTDANQVTEQGVACATKKQHYVEPTDEGKRWLVQEWPKYARDAVEVFQQKQKELAGDGQS